MQALHEALAPTTRFQGMDLLGARRAQGSNDLARERSGPSLPENRWFNEIEHTQQKTI